MDHHIFLIGPGGVGKTSCGPHLAKFLGRDFIDLDQLFVSGPGDIGGYIADHGYVQYVRENSKIFFERIAQCRAPSVCALSSGFLIAEVEAETVELNRAAVRGIGYSILPLPHANVQECTRIVVSRQLQRGFNLSQDTEQKKFLKRLPIYRTLADQVTVSQGVPAETACSIYKEMVNARALQADIR
ncbi:MAG: shikimate kinase [Pseudomonadota bacterium]